MPTDEQRALWAAIRAHPTDDTPRLVYADWLQEHGDEHRAEFVRVQCALEVLGPDRRKGRKQRGPLEARLAKLATHQEAWLAPFRTRLKGARWSGDNWLNDLKFRRGFVDGIHFNLSTVAAVARAGDDLEPVDRVEMWEMGANYDHPAVAAIAAWPGAGCVTGFSIAFAADADAQVIVRGHMSNLRHLGLWYGKVSDAGVAELAAWPAAASLRSLDLKDNPITDAGAVALAESPHLGGLTRLDLHGIRFNKKARATLRERFGDALAINTDD